MRRECFLVKVIMQPVAMKRSSRSRRQNNATRGPSGDPGKSASAIRRWVLILAALALLPLALAMDGPGQWCRLLARRALENNAPHAAMLWIERARAIDGSNSDTDLLQVRAFVHLNMSSRALESLALAARHGSDEEEVRRYTDLVLAQRGELEAAERLTTVHASSLPPRQVLEVLVRCAMFHGRFDWGLSLIERWDQQFPGDAGADYYRGRLFELQEQPQEALLAYQAAHNRQPSLAKAAFRSAVLQREQRKLAEAERAFLQCGGSPYEPIAMIEAADCRWQQGANEAAWELVEPWVDSPPQELSELYLQVDEFVEDDRAALVAARVKESQGDMEATVALLERVLDFNHRHLEAQGLLASAFRSLGRAAEADRQTALQREMIDKQRQCVELSIQLKDAPHNLEARCDLAELYMECYSLGDAQLELKEILVIAPKCSRAHELLSRIYREKSRFDDRYSQLADRHERLGRAGDRQPVAGKKKEGIEPAKIRRAG